MGRSRFAGCVASAALTALVATSAHADPVAVQYFVARNAFNANTKGTDVLLFELFSDASCTTPLDSESLFANDTCCASSSIARRR
jgi:hypothetical protein